MQSLKCKIEKIEKNRTECWIKCLRIINYKKLSQILELSKLQKTELNAKNYGGIITQTEMKNYKKNRAE